MKSKTCSSCKKRKPLTEFNKSKVAKDGLNYSCRGCTVAYHKRWYKAKCSPEKEVRDYRSRISIQMALADSPFTSKQQMIDYMVGEYTKGRSTRSIGGEVGLSGSAVIYRLRLEGVKLRPRGGNNHLNRGSLKRYYCYRDNKYRTAKEVAEFAGISVHTVYQRDKNGIPIDAPRRVKDRSKTIKVLMVEHLKLTGEWVTALELAKLFECSPMTIRARALELAREDVIIREMRYKSLNLYHRHNYHLYRINESVPNTPITGVKP